MRKSKGSSYIIELPLVTEKYEADEINTRLECGRNIYNALVTVTMKRYREMVKTRIYRSLISELFEVNTKMKNKEEKGLGVNKKGDKREADKTAKRLQTERIRVLRGCKRNAMALQEQNPQPDSAGYSGKCMESV